MRRLLTAVVLCAVIPIVLLVGLGANGGGAGYEVRAIFDNVASAVPGEDVKVAGAKIGVIESMDVTDQKKAAVVLRIDDDRFAPFRRDAKCSVRPQSLIGEKFVECTPGTAAEPELEEIQEGDGEGQHLLPLEQTSSPVDLDLINNIMRRPYAERFSILLAEFGTGLAGRGKELNEVISRANPALKELDEVVAVLAQQNRVLANLARDSDTVLAPLAREKEAVADFIVQANATGEATAERRADIEAGIQRLPRFLRELKPLMADLGSFAGQAAPVARNLNASGRDVSRLIRALGPFSTASTTSLTSLGDALETGRPALLRTRPLIQDLGDFAVQAKPLSSDLAALLESFDETDGIESLLNFVYFSMTAVNGFDDIGHYLRASLNINLCTPYAFEPASGCNANFTDTRVVGSSAAAKREARAQIAKEPPEDSRGKRAADRPGARRHPGRRDLSGGPPQRPAHPPQRAAPLARARGRRGAHAGLPAGERRMTRRGTGGSLAGSPVLVGAVTLLVSIVAVFLSYNANSGLPFVPTYDVRIQLPNAANLVRGNEVRIGGARVGVIDKIDAVQRGDEVNAVVDAKLDADLDPLPIDSTFIVRPRSALGLKYIELTPGVNKAGFAAGTTIPLSQATPEPVEIDEVFNMFDAPTRRGGQQSLDGFGTGFAGRGRSLNSAIAELRPLLRDLEPVATNLSARNTQLARFFKGLGGAAAEVAPVAEEQAELFVNLDTTFTALAGVARPFFQDFISEQPPTYDTAIREFPRQRPFLRNSAAFFRELRPGIATLPTSAPILADATEIGAKVLPRTPPLNAQLASVFDSLAEFAEDPNVPTGVKRLEATAKSLKPTIAFLKPSQTVCNYPTLFFRNAASHLSEGDSNGTWQRFIIIAAPVGPNNEGSPSNAPGNGPGPNNFKHVNPYPNSASPGQTKECEAGNEDYVSGRQVFGNVSGNQGTVTSGQPGSEER